MLGDEQRFRKHGVVGTFADLEGWVIIGDSKGQVKLFNVDNYAEVNVFLSILTIGV